MPMGSTSMCSNTFYVSCGWYKQFEVAVSLNHSTTTCVRLLLYANGQHINVLKHFVYVSCECGKQFEVAVSLNLDIITSFCLHK